MRDVEGELAPADVGEVAPDGAMGLRLARPSDATPATPRGRFLATTAWLDGGVPVVSVVGELDLATAPAFEDALLALSGRGDGAVIADLALCDFMDLRGLHVLLDARARLERAGRKLLVVTGNRELLRIFKITRVGKVLAIYPSVAAALEVNGNG